jgi:hypothetical protein
MLAPAIRGLPRIAGVDCIKREEAAQTVADYRRMMSPQDKTNLGAYFHSGAGRAQIQEATACYRSKDVRFRSVTAPVIRELLTTFTTVQ